MLDKHFKNFKLLPEMFEIINAVYEIKVELLILEEIIVFRVFGVQSLIASPINNQVPKTFQVLFCINDFENNFTNSIFLIQLEQTFAATPIHTKCSISAT